MKGITTPLPLIEASRARHGPCKLVLADEPYVLWRAGDRWLAASAVCPHRGADLSTGRVCGEALTCPYHGWAVGADGDLFSPFENTAKGHVAVYPLTERFGLLWLNGDEAHFEALARAGGEYFGPMTFAFEAPLHVTVDNFCDGTHVPYVHARNGANPDQVDETTFAWHEDDLGVTIAYDYTQRPGTIMTLLNGFRRTRWSITARIEFRPIRVQYTISWYVLGSRRVLNGINGNTYYFYPAKAGHTTAICLLFQQEIPAHLRPFKRVFARVLRRLTRDLIEEDMALAARILATGTSFAGCRLERFDAPIVRVRQRLLETQEFQT